MDAPQRKMTERQRQKSAHALCSDGHARPECALPTCDRIRLLTLHRHPQRPCRTSSCSVLFDRCLFFPITRAGCSSSEGLRGVYWTDSRARDCWRPVGGSLFAAKPTL